MGRHCWNWVRWLIINLQYFSLEQQLNQHRLIMVHCNRIKTKTILNTLVFLSGLGILIWQIQKTIFAFIKAETTFTVSKQRFDKMMPPAMVICPQSQWDNGLFTEPKINMSDKNLFFQQSFRINEKLNLAMTRMISDK